MRIVFMLPLLLPLPNRTRGQHWSKIRDYKIELAWDVKLALRDSVCLLPDRPFDMSRITVWRHSVQRPDTDNLYASLKPLCDVLQPCTAKRKYGLGVIVDDAPGVCEMRAFWNKAPRRNDQRTVVAVEEWVPEMAA